MGPFWAPRRPCAPGGRGARGNTPATHCGRPTEERGPTRKTQAPAPLDRAPRRGGEGAGTAGAKQERGGSNGAPMGRSLAPPRRRRHKEAQPRRRHLFHERRSRAWLRGVRAGERRRAYRAGAPMGTPARPRAHSRNQNKKGQQPPPSRNLHSNIQYTQTRKRLSATLQR